MFRTALALLLLATASWAVRAHFVYVVPAQDGKTVTAVLSEDLEVDDAVAAEKIAGLKFVVHDADGKSRPIVFKVGPHSLTGELGTGTPKLGYGSVNYGVIAKKDAKPSLLVYHPKVVFAGTSAKEATLGEAAPLEVVPFVVEGKTRFRLLAAGKPVGDAEGSILLPDGTKAKVKTDSEGFTATYAQSGRYAVWLRQIETKFGELDGKKYEEVKHYATLVVDVARK